MKIWEKTVGSELLSIIGCFEKNAEIIRSDRMNI